MLDGTRRGQIAGGVEAREYPDGASLPVEEIKSIARRVLASMRRNGDAHLDDYSRPDPEQGFLDGFVDGFQVHFMACSASL